MSLQYLFRIRWINPHTATCVDGCGSDFIAFTDDEHEAKRLAFDMQNTDGILGVRLERIRTNGGWKIVTDVGGGFDDQSEMF